MMQWNPIETVPKNGFVLVYVKRDKCKYGEVLIIDCVGFYDGVPKPDGCTLTHWMPLPTPPCEAKE